MDTVKLHQINEPDLAELERVMPELTQHVAMHGTNRQKVQLRRVQQILSNVRWNYGPYAEVEIINGPEDGPPGGHTS